MSVLHGEKGISIIAVIIMMLMIAVMGQGLVAMVGTENFSTVNQMKASQAHYIAESGVERAMYEFENGTLCNALAYTDPVGAGSYTTRGTLYNPLSTTLSVGISNVDTTIPLASIAGYAPHGRITIEAETIDYGGTSTTSCAPFGTPCLTGAERGINGSTPVVHLSAVLVNQNQCLISSSGTVAGFPGASERVIEAGTQQGSIGSTVQSGTAVSSANGTLTVAIPTLVVTARSFLIFNTRHNSNRPVGSMIRGRIASTNTLEFARVTNEGAPVPISIQWYVVEFPSGVNVQRGSVNQTGTSINVPLATPVASLTQAFVTWSKTPQNNDDDYKREQPILGELTATSNLQFRVDRADANHTIWWQVIEFTNAADILVQKGSTTALNNGGVLSTDETLGTPVDVTKTFVLAGYITPHGGSDVGERMIRAQLIDPTTIRIDRSVGGDRITEIAWQAVTLNSSTVQHGTQNFPAFSGTQIVVTLAGDVRAIHAGAVSIAGAEAGIPEDIVPNANTNQADILTNITTSTNEAWLIDVVGSGRGGSFDPDPGQSERWDSNGNGASAAMSTKPGPSTAGPDSMYQDHGNDGRQIVHIVASVKPKTITGGPITFDNQSSGSSNTDTVSWTHVIGTGIDRKLLVGVTVHERPAAAGIGDENVLSVTYGGVPLTFAAEETIDRGNRRQHAELWYLDEAGLPAGGTGTTQNVPITAVDLTRAVVFSPVQAVAGQSLGRTSYNGDDVIGVSSATMALSSSTLLTMERDNTVASADISWFVVEFAISGGGFIDWREIF